MKKILVFLLLAFLASSFLSVLTFASAVFQTDSIETSTAVDPAYSGSGSLILYDVDYWWIPNVSKDEIVLLNIVQNQTVSYESWLKYSNLTVIQDRIGFGTHDHDFVAGKTDDYLLKINAYAGSFNYTVNCDHPIWKEPMHIVRGNLSNGGVYDYWISNISEDEVFLMSTFPDQTVSYESWLKYSNLTVIQDRIGFGTHDHDFVAGKTDDYLLKINAYAGSFNYTIKHSARALPTEITFSVEPSPATVGQTVTILGNLTTDTGTPIPNANITIKVNGTPQLSRLTNSTGWFKAFGQVSSAGTFNITTEYAGSAQYLPSSAWKILVVNKVQTEIYAKFIPNPVNPGGACELRGILLDQFGNPIKSTAVSLEYSTDYGLSWHPAGTLTTNSYGIFSKTFPAPSPGIYLIRIKYAGSSSHESSTTTTALIVR